MFSELIEIFLVQFVHGILEIIPQPLGRLVRRMEHMLYHQFVESKYTIHASLENTACYTINLLRGSQSL